MTIKALIEAGKKARDTGEREAILEYGKLSFHALPEIEELVEFNRWLIALADNPSTEPYSACEQIANKLDRIRELVVSDE